jgi:hypothetical protein
MNNCSSSALPEDYTSLFEELAKKKITHVNAGYRKFKIVPTRNLYSEDTKCFGVTDFDRCIIYLEIEVEEGTAKEVFLHELTHIALEMVGLGGSEDSDAVPHISVYDNEQLTTILSRINMLLMNLNPQLYKLLIS